MRALVTLWLLAFVALLAAPATPARGAIGALPVLAYYYIWFEESSWDRAKVDFPLLGRYSSDDEEVMERHVIWAKAAGIDGFIVSWKSTPKLNDRLERLIKVSERLDFKLAMIYQALDFEREPLPVDQINADLAFFAQEWAARRPFQLFERPVMILSGTREFTPNKLREAIGMARERLLVLASERTAVDYAHIAEFFDGNAYYLSSANPSVSTAYEKRLSEIGRVVHDRGGLWIAPAAPGFDARLVGGTRVVNRNGTDTLRAQIAGAVASSPDALGIISWNEFSENTHVEPSVNYGTEALDALAEITGRELSGIDFDSDEPADTLPSINVERGLALGGLALLVALAVFVIARRGTPPVGPDEGVGSSPPRTDETTSHTRS